MLQDLPVPPLVTPDMHFLVLDIPMLLQVKMQREIGLIMKRKCPELPQKSCTYLYTRVGI